MTSTKAIISLTTMDDSLHLPRMIRNIPLLLSSRSLLNSKKGARNRLLPSIGFPPTALIPLHFQRQAHERNTAAGTDTQAGSE